VARLVNKVGDKSAGERSIIVSTDYINFAQENDEVEIPIFTKYTMEPEHHDAIPEEKIDMD
jgi:hypothetical protein